VFVREMGGFFEDEAGILGRFGLRCNIDDL